MGIHFLKGPLDEVVEAQQPEVLVYEPQANGRMKLVALEYVSTAPTSLFGQEFGKTRPRTVCRWQRGRELRLDAARLDLDAEPDRGADALEPAGDLRQRLTASRRARSRRTAAPQPYRRDRQRCPGVTISPGHAPVFVVSL